MYYEQDIKQKRFHYETIYAAVGTSNMFFSALVINYIFVYLIISTANIIKGLAYAQTDSRIVFFMSPFDARFV